MFSWRLLADDNDTLNPLKDILKSLALDCIQTICEPAEQGASSLLDKVWESRILWVHLQQGGL